MPRVIPVLLALLFSLAPTASAIDLAGNDILIPVAGRTPGASGTFWQTDLVLTNLSPEYTTLRVHVRTWDGGEPLEFDLDLPALGTVMIEDFMRTRFGRETAVGLVRITNSLDDAQLAARARVYTNGDVGQSVPGIPIDQLAQESFIPGLTGTPGNRSNLGIANPNSAPADVTLDLLGPQGHRLDTASMQIAPHSVVQQEISTVFDPEDTRADVTVRVTSSQPVLAFGSVVRTASADPSFILATKTRKTADFEVTPQCEEPAPLIVAPGRVTPGWIIAYKAGTDTKTVTPRLMEKYGFTPSFTLGIFVAAALTPEMIAGLRCEPEVRSISQGSHVSLEE